MVFIPRASQQEILSYRCGKMGISAVPGSGKTWTLSRLAADIISRGELQAGQEVLVVTLVNSAVENFSNRINGFIAESGLLPKIGYRVRTLHGLAHDIVRENPSLVGLDEKFQIIEEHEASLILNEISINWLQTHRDSLFEYINPDLQEYQLERINNKYLPELINSIASSFIRSAKDKRLTPDILQNALGKQPAELPLAVMGCELYHLYQRALAYRGAVDFDDLIAMALDLLEMDSTLLERLRFRWPMILEDEAQDSSLLQEQILRKLCGDDGNWIRVGDPNQAIFETFTTANPWLLRNFITKEAEFQYELPESGRSQLSIIKLANYLVDWVKNEHPVSEVQDALIAPPYIKPTHPDDPQANPPDSPDGIVFLAQDLSPAEEIKVIMDSIEEWLPENKQKTIAVLAPINSRGSEVVDELKRREIDHIEYLNSNISTRAGAGVLGNVLAFLAEPDSSKKLAKCYQVWRRKWGDQGESDSGLYNIIPILLRKCERVEEFLAPSPERDWLDEFDQIKPTTAFPGITEQAINQELRDFQEVIQRWQNTTLLPIDQIIITLAQDLFTEPADLALSFHLSNILAQSTRDHPSWNIKDIVGELTSIARNERKFMGFSPESSGFDPGKHAGKVVVTTVHKAKGLEWDRVYLISVNNYDFPSGSKHDSYKSEKWYLRPDLNLEAESLEQLKILFTNNEYLWYQEGQATKKARLDYVRERLRLLYVGITRARQDLILSWNKGRRNDKKPSLPFLALHSWWQLELDKIETI